MTGTPRRQDGDAISRLADAGEDTLRRLVDLPRRAVVGVIDRVDARLRNVATRVRAVDPLAGRVERLEKRLDSLEKPKQTAARKASTRGEGSVAPKGEHSHGARGPGQLEHGRGGRDELERKDQPE
jgi:hypothetical protein